MVEKAQFSNYQTVPRSARTFNTWVLLDFSRFAISKLRDMELSSNGLTPEQTAVLKMLMNRNGKSTIIELANYWMRQPNSISTLINRMEKQGLVAKVKHPGRKELEIAITEKGREFHSKVVQDSLDEVFSTLSQDDLLKLAQYLQLLLIKSRKMLGYRSDLPVI